MPASTPIALAVTVLALAQCGARTGSDDAEPGSDASSEPAALRPDACLPRTVTLEVPISAPWVATGLIVVAGSHLIVHATGTVRYGGGADQIGDANGSSYPQKFFPAAVLPNTIISTLIGKVGGTTTIDTGAPVPEGAPGAGPGFVGASYDQVMTASGPLFLGYNDQRDWYYDNVGSVTVTITTGC